MDSGATPGLAPLVTAIHGALDVGVQVQLLGAATLKSAAPPAG
jgi:hypothetical protein